MIKLICSCFIVKMDITSKMKEVLEQQWVEKEVQEATEKLQKTSTRMRVAVESIQEASKEFENFDLSQNASQFSEEQQQEYETVQFEYREAMRNWFSAIQRRKEVLSRLQSFEESFTSAMTKQKLIDEEVRKDLDELKSQLQQLVETLSMSGTDASSEEQVSVARFEEK